MKQNHLMILGLALCLSLGCDDPDQPGASGEFIHVYGTAEEDYGNALVATSDGGFAIAGEQEVSGKANDALLIRTDANGGLLFTKSYGGAGHDDANDILQLPDGGFLLVGSTESDNNKDAWVFRTDAAGDSLWSVKIDKSNKDEARAVCVLPDGSFAVVGTTGDSPNLLIVCISAAGVELWQHNYGGALETYGYSIAASGDELVVCGTQYINGLDYQLYVLRVNAQGDMIWENNFGIDEYDEGRAITVLADNSIAVAGFTQHNDVNMDIVIRRLTASGDSIAGETWSTKGGDEDAIYAKHLLELGDGTLVLAGTTQSKGEGAADFNLLTVKIGVEKAVIDVTFGGPNDDIAMGVVRTKNDGYAMVGYSKSFQFQDNYDVVLLRTNAAGKLIE